MRTRIISLIVIAMTTLSMNVQAQDSSTDKKVLVAYFSRSGNTRAVADHIKSLTGGDMFEIQVAKPYPEEYHACTEVAKKEKEDNARPTLKTKVENMASYDVIFIGYPNWWGTMPMPILTFLESYDFAGKKIALFATSGGSGFGKTVSRLEGSVDKSAEFVSEKLLNRAGKAEIESWLKSWM